jgi:cyclopropane fatty-acyl-phospholipid synthase-like methyltransferase
VKLKSMRAAARRTLASAFARAPARSRAWIVSWLPRPLVPRFMRAAATYDVEFWDRFYAEVDPWGFDRHAHERRKYERTLAVCGPGPFGRVLEIGCGEGAFTELIAPHASEVVAIEISPVAAARARQRLARFPGVTVAAASFPDAIPEGPFDVVVASDTFLYVPVPDIERGLSRLEAALAPNGALVAVDYVGGRTYALLTGDEVHDVLVSSTSLAHTFSERHEISEGRPYLVDRFEKTAPESPKKKPASSDG